MSSATFSDRFLSVVGKGMALAGRPGECGGQLARAIQDLTGAKAVLLIECLEHSGLNHHRLAAAIPLQAGWIATHQDMEGLAVLSHDYLQSTAIDILHARGEEAVFLREMRASNMVVVPLCYAGERMGALFLFGVEAPDRFGGLLAGLDSSASLLGMILHNDFLCQNLEHLVDSRSAELIHTHEALRQNEERYRALFSEMSDPVLVAEAHSGIIVDCNKAAEAYFGRPREQLVGSHQRSLHPESEVQGGFSRGFVRHVQNPEEALETRVVAASGRVRLVKIRVSKLELGGVTCLMGIFRDITERRVMEQALTFLATSSEPGGGRGFFETLAEFLSETLEMEFVCIDRLHGDAQHARTLAVYHQGVFEDNITYALKDTPCAEVVDRDVCCFPQNVCELFPGDPVLREIKAESYAGITLRNASGQATGLIAVIGQRPLEDISLAESILHLVAVRASGELDRLMAEEATEASLRDKELLLREIHHRVKNNLQIVSSLLSLQEMNLEDEAALQVLAESRGRVASMALIHEQLYRTHTFSRIEVEGYLRDLLPRLVSSFSRNRDIRVEISASGVGLNIDQAIPFGLLVNELATNSLKHAFNGRDKGVVRVDVSLRDGSLSLVFEDDGVGLPEDFDPFAAGTLGLQIVKLLAGQLRGEFGVEAKRGTRFTLRFPLQSAEASNGRYAIRP
ncbi:sensor histidine kinase [Fundidesulfovibrio agrisoli]|uniref:sensor histidine kinase n=1 Tax=Fundidesulfovibrio agrisoli TaxID=2922717 RepID=UPI001FAB5509|nr:histidine kinase dimerization/phosphoacceptor domain -containing protein [Fundidesulfovibrio agrisoli]